MVSVVISTYKREGELRRAIESVLNQTYKNYEIIVIDDNGRGTPLQIRTKKLIDKYIQNGKRVKYFSNEINLGGGLARNVGIQKSSGKYIAFLDDDDEFLPLKVEEQVRLFENSINENLALVYCYATSYDNDGNRIMDYCNDIRGSENCIYNQMLSCIAATSQWLCRTDLLREISGFHDVPSRQDSNLMLRLLLSGYAIDRVDKILLKYNSHSGARISTGGLSMLEGNLKYRELCRRNYNLLSSREIRNVEGRFSFVFSKIFIKNRCFDLVKEEIENLWHLNKKQWLKIVIFRELVRFRISG